MRVEYTNGRYTLRPTCSLEIAELNSLLGLEINCSSLEPCGSVGLPEVDQTQCKEQ